MTNQISYKDLFPASEHASAAGKGASRKADTKPEIRLRRALWESGARYRKNVQGLPGKPDIVFISARIVVFCDGDFWHGKDWTARRNKLKKGSNPEYWIAKIEKNIERDLQLTEILKKEGWSVFRFWESEIDKELDRVVSFVLEALRVRAKG